MSNFSQFNVALKRTILLLSSKDISSEIREMEEDAKLRKGQQRKIYIMLKSTGTYFFALFFPLPLDVIVIF